MLNESTRPLTSHRLRTPRSAAPAGILFAILAGTSGALIQLSIPPVPPYDTEWLVEQAGRVSLAVTLVSFAGIASILYVLTVLEAEELTDRETIFTAAMITVFFNVMAHGISAAPLANWYGKHITVMDKLDAADAETIVVPEIPTRRKSVTTISRSSPPMNNSS